jgi:integrase/recombinase XerD
MTTSPTPIPPNRLPAPHLPDKRLNKKPWRSAVARLEGAYSPNTIRAYIADFAAFEAWCESVALKALPARPSTIAWFIGVDAQKSSASTLTRRLAAIRKVHRLFRLGNPAEDEEVKTATRRALRSKLKRPRQALGLTREFRDRLLGACPDTLMGNRDRALIALGYDTLCRRAELVGLRVEDLSSDQKGRGATILIRRAKNDIFGNGRLGYVSEQTHKVVQNWLKLAHISEGWIFRGIYGDHVGKEALHPYTVNRILKSRAEAANLPEAVIEGLSGHSMRVGAAQDLITSGLGLLPIMQAGGWKTVHVVGRYVEKANLGALIANARASSPSR